MLVFVVKLISTRQAIEATYYSVAKSKEVPWMAYFGIGNNLVRKLNDAMNQCERRPS